MDLMVPAAVGSSALVAAAVFGYTKLRPHFPVHVNCWFCNSNTKVPYRRKDCFVCPACKQYNGFNKDGDYNCDLPAQYCESLNSPPSRTNRQSSTPVAGLSLGNGLCQTCNLYQAMKVKALAEFVPSHPDKFDEEVEVYERRLERLYGGLCRICTQTLKCTLGEQDSWLKPKLIHWRLQQTALMKELLSPLHRGLSRQRQLLASMLRLVCLVVAVLLFVAPFSTNLTVLNRNKSNSSTQQESNSTLGTWQMMWQRVPMALPESLLGSCAVLLQHEAGSALLLLALMLTAVALAGRSRVRMSDAAGCLLLVMLLAVCCGQQSASVPGLLLEHLGTIKAVLCAVVSLMTFVGLSRPDFSPPRWSSPPLTSSPRRSQGNLGSDDSACSSSDLSADSTILQSPNTFNDETSTAPPSVVSSEAPPSSQLRYPSSAPSLASSAPFSHPTPAEHLVHPRNPSVSATVNPFLAKSLIRGNNGLTASGPASFTNFWPVNEGASGSKFSLQPSAMESSLDTSLGSLQIGTPRKNYVFGASVQNGGGCSSLVNGGHLSLPSGRGMTLRSHAAASRRPQTVNGIAQTSWVAGGYWGSPSKNPRIPSNPHPHLMQQHRPPPLHFPPNEPEEVFPQSRSSSQSSGFVSHGSGSQHANFPPAPGGGAAGNRGSVSSTADFPVFPPTSDRASVVSETSFVWNYESCETSSQGSQRTDFDPIVEQAGARLQQTPAFSEAPRSSAASSSMAPSHNAWMLQERSLHPVGGGQSRTRSPLHDLQAMRALSRLSSHDLSDDDLSLLGMGAVTECQRVSTPSEVGTPRNPWLAFVLGMSVMANGFLAVFLYNNNTLSHFMMKS